MHTAEQKPQSDEAQEAQTSQSPQSDEAQEAQTSHVGDVLDRVVFDDSND